MDRVEEVKYRGDTVKTKTRKIWAGAIVEWIRVLALHTANRVHSRASHIVSQTC